MAEVVEHVVTRAGVSAERRPSRSSSPAGGSSDRTPSPDVEAECWPADGLQDESPALEDGHSQSQEAGSQTADPEITAGRRTPQESYALADDNEPPPELEEDSNR